MLNRLLTLTTLCGILVLTGCVVTVPPAELPSRIVPRHVAMLTEGAEITAENSDWKLAGTDPVKPPFLSDGPQQVPSDGILDAYDEFLATGAELVRIRVPGREKALYGVLHLGRVFETSLETSAKRTYRISIPPNRVADALGGQVSVVYQPYSYQREAVASDPAGNQFYVKKKDSSASWVLWLSDAPFPGQEASVATPPAMPVMESATHDTEASAPGTLKPNR